MSFRNQDIQTFADALASGAPVPGGGGASALVGAIGTALGSMVGALTVGKPKYAAVDAEMREQMQKADAVREGLLRQIDEDARCFEPLSRAYKLPAETEAQREEKAAVMEACLVEACSVPLEIMEGCCKAIALQREFAEKGNSLALSDAGVGVTFCKAALQSAALNVFSNTKSMQDRACAEKLNRQALTMLSEYIPMADAIYAGVFAQIAPAENGGENG